MTNDASAAVPPRLVALSPLDLEINDVLSFISSCLPRPPGSVLEVGCGEGRLAAKLRARGFRVEAIDTNLANVVAAAKNGIDAQCIDLLDFTGGPFDAVLFTRSLHHISPLGAAVTKARELVAPGGVLVIDEFAHDEVDNASTIWFYDVMAMLDDAGVLASHPARFHHQHSDADRSPPTSLEAWKRAHAHDPALHGARAMLDALGASFDITRMERPPHFYRLFAGRLPPNERGALVLKGIRELEEAFIAAGALVSLGLRVVGRRS
jgi:SAM-dependent methyltransferase